MADHSQKWHDGSSNRYIEGSSNSERITAIVNKLENLGQDMKKLKENVYAIQVGCQNCGGAHLDKDCPLNEEVKRDEEAKHGEFGRSSTFNNGAKYRVGLLRYYTRIDNRPPFREKRPSLEDLMNKHLEESTRRRAKMEEWEKKLQENAKINTRNQSASLKNLDTQIEQLTKEFHTKTANEINNSSFDQCKAVYADEKTPLANKQHEVSFVSNKCTPIVQEKFVSSKVLPCQLPPKEMNLGNFTLSCTIRSLNFYDMADLGASVNVIPKSMFEHLKLAQLKKTDMLDEMADITKRSPIKIVENVLIKIDKFLFPLDFMVMDMLNTRNETMILGRPFLATIHAKIDVFNK
ncbi:reverse transcriptase domain-containing protein [Tanacetum coccineum]